MPDSIMITLPGASAPAALDDLVGQAAADIASLQSDVASLKSGLAAQVAQEAADIAAVKAELTSQVAIEAKNAAAIAVAQTALTSVQAVLAALKAPPASTVPASSTGATGSAPAGSSPAGATSSASSTGSAPASSAGSGDQQASSQAGLLSISAASVSSNTVWVHGPYPANGANLPAGYDMSLDGGKTWPHSAGFAHDNGAWDSWVYGLALPPGTYTVMIRDSANHADVATAPGTYTINANTAPASVSFSPAKFSTSLPNTTPIGIILASGGTPQFALVLTEAAGNSAGYSITGIGNGRWQVAIADNGKLAAGNNTLAGKVASGDASISFSFTFAVAQGIIVDPSAMIFTPAPDLSNAATVGSPAFTLGIKGYSGGTFSILSQDGAADPANNMPARYTVTGTTGTATNTLSAQTESLLLSWTDGVNTCVAPQSLTVASVLGTGPALSVSDQASLNSVMGLTQTDPDGKYRGAVVTIGAGSYQPGWLEPGAADGWNGNGFLGPLTIQGAKGVLPIFDQPGAWIPNGKGAIETEGWDVLIIGLEFANLWQSYPGEVGNFAGIKLNAGCLGKTTIQGIYSHNCTDGVLGGEPGQIVEISDSEFAKNGGGDGFTHNFYIAAVSHATVQRVVSWGANVGHDGKCRAAAGLFDGCAFADGPLGCASYLLDLPDGGAHVVRDTIFDKGPNAQNSPLLAYGEECQNNHPVNTLLVDGCTFINRAVNPPKLYNGDTIYPVGVRAALASGRPATVTIRNSKFFGFDSGQYWQSGNANTVIVDGGGNQFLPLSEAPDPATYLTHPWQGLGYSSSTAAPGPYLGGPMAGK